MQRRAAIFALLGLILVAPSTVDAGGPASVTSIDALNVWLKTAKHGGSVELVGGTTPDDPRSTWTGHILCDNVRGTQAEPITVRVKPGTFVKVVPSPDPFSDEDDLRPLLDIADCGHLHVEGLSLGPYKAPNHAEPDAAPTPIGVRIHATRANTMPGIKLRKCTVIGIDANYRPWADYASRREAHANAHGILVVSATQEAPISELSIEGCIVKDCRLGNSEALALNGNVVGFVLRDNELANNDNIGIDLIGGEHGQAGQSWNAARFGRVINNRVTSIRTAGNPAYLPEDGGSPLDIARGAAGIYVDGGRSISIADNVVRGCDHGIEVGCENSLHRAFQIQITGNRIAGCSKALVLGSDDRALAGDEATGDVQHVMLSRNTTLATASDQVPIEFLRIRSVTIDRNVFVLHSATSPLFAHHTREGPCHQVAITCNNTVRAEGALVPQPYINWSEPVPIPWPNPLAQPKGGVTTWSAMCCWLGSSGKGASLRWTWPVQFIGRAPRPERKGRSKKR